MRHAVGMKPVSQEEIRQLEERLAAAPPARVGPLVRKLVRAKRRLLQQ